MKKIINDKKYDTETTKPIYTRAIHSIVGNELTGKTLVIGSWETIYQKKSGEYFIYREATGNNPLDITTSISPLSDSLARQYLQEWMDGQEYEDMFGPVDE